MRSRPKKGQVVRLDVDSRSDSSYVLCEAAYIQNTTSLSLVRRNIWVYLFWSYPM